MQQGTLKNQFFSGSTVYHLLSVFFICLGLAGIILMAESVPEISFLPAPLILIAIGVTAGLYFSNLFSKPLFYGVLTAIVVFCISYILSDREGFASQWQFLFSGMVPDPGETSSDIGRVALILTVFFSLLIFFFDILLKLHAVSFFITTAFILIPSLFGYSFPAHAIIFTVIYQLAFFILPLSFKRNSTRSEKLQQRIRVKSTLLAIAAALVALAIATPIAIGTGNNTFENVARMENSALNNLGLSPFALLYNDEGNVNKGDNNLNGVITLKLSADRDPGEDIYMRGYFGGNYYGDYWDAPTDNVIFDALAPSSDISKDASELAEVYNALRYHTSTKNYGNDDAAVQMNVRNLNINRSVIFRPYNASEEDTSGGSGYSFKFYGYNDLNMAFSDNDPQELLSYRKLFRDYYADAYDNYTYITAESVPRLKELVRANPLDDVSEITDFIINTLDEHAEYTLNPGAAPDGADMVDYFLFENHKGYCQQFASAAVLMYRLYGIPARYATGFRVKNNDFTLNEGKGSYEATVTDERAHAWPEILIPEYGWVPVEVTPAANRGISGGNLSPENDPLSSGAEPTAPATTPALPDNPETDGTGSSEEGASSPGDVGSDSADSQEASSSSGTSSGNAGDSVNVLPWLIPVLAGAAAVAAYFAFRRKKLSNEQLSFDTIYKRLRVLLKNAPEPVTCEFYDKEFPIQLLRAVPELSEAEAKAAYDNILSALYGRDGADAAHKAFLKSLYTKCAGYILPRTPAGKRAVLKYIRMLG